MTLVPRRCPGEIAAELVARVPSRNPIIMAPPSPINTDAGGKLNIRNPNKLPATVNAIVAIKRSPFAMPITALVRAAKKQIPPARPSIPSTKLMALVIAITAKKKRGIPYQPNSTGPIKGKVAVFILWPPTTKIAAPKNWPVSFTPHPKCHLSSKVPSSKIQVVPRNSLAFGFSWLI